MTESMTEPMTEPMTMTPTTLLITDPAYLDHDTGPGHPERAARLERILADLGASPVAGTSWARPRPATDAELAAVHDPAYLAALAAMTGTSASLDPDTTASPGTIPAARLAAGAAAMAVGEVWAGRARNAFALVRPPGHHAELARAMGFCVLNNAAVAAESARRLGAARVAILDWDVHHGNGTQHLFEDRSDVLVLSSHQYPFYPGTGAPEEIGRGAGTGFTVNCALGAGQGDAEYGAVFADLFLPALERFAPDFLIVSAGFDAHARDPLAEMQVSERGFAAMCSAAADVAARSAGGRMVLLLEGGYDLEALAASVRACVEVLAGARERFPAGVGRGAPRAIAATRQALAGAGHPLPNP
jgi:acetoin utilization deacetylase AcuC-like enzyme